MGVSYYIGTVEVTGLTEKPVIVDANRPDCAGAVASQKKLFGPNSRFALFAIHTRFDAVQWVITDAENPDEVTGEPAIIRQLPDFDVAKNIVEASEQADGYGRSDDAVRIAKTWDGCSFTKVAS